MTARHTASVSINVTTPQFTESDELREQISKRAYELYQMRGMQDGFAEQDWLQAEAELTSLQALKAAA